MALTSSLARSFDAPADASAPIVGRLDMAHAAVEQRFLHAGETLGQAVDGVGVLIAALEQLAETLDPETVNATTDELRAASASLLVLPDKLARRRQIIARMAGVGDSLAGCIGDIRQNLAYLRVYAINIKITVGGIAEAGEDFGQFAQEICDCIELGRVELNAFDADLTALCSELTNAARHEEALAERCRGLLPAVPDGLTACAADMTDHHLQVSKVALDVARLAKDVQKKVGGALAALQIGDITRQRIEHVQQGLDRLPGVAGLTGDARERLERVIFSLMAAQLRATSDDFHRDVERIGHNMTGMAESAREILRLRELALGASAGGDQGVLRRLEQHVAEALALVAEMEDADQAAARVGAAAAAGAGDLTARITSLGAIRSDVQQMALNTTLKCSRIGEMGKPLAVIALELRLQGGHIEVSARDALTAINSLGDDAGALTAANGVGDPGQSTGAGAALTDAAARLRRAGDSVETDLAGLARQGEAVVDLLTRAAARMDFQVEIGAILDEAANELHRLAGPTLPATDDLAEPLRELLGAIFKTYTMAQERDVHTAITAGLNLEAAVAWVEAPAAEDLDDVLF